MMKIAAVTGADNYFEDFEVGMAIRHARGKTLSNLDNVLITNMVMNTAHGHFNEHAMRTSGMTFGEGKIVSYGGVNFSMVLGLAAQDCIENALEELGLDNIKLSRAVTHGDTLYAMSEVLEKRDSEREDAGIIRFRHFGFNQDDEQVAQIERIVLMKRKSHWAGR